MLSLLRDSVRWSAMGVGIILLSVGPCLAHEDPAEELGHHWAIPAYSTEIRLQMCIVFGGLLLFHLGKLALAYLRRKAE